MPSNASPQQLRQLGSQIAQFVQTQAVASRSPGTLQGVIADLTASYPDLAVPLRDLTGRQAFHALIPFALSGRGSIQRDALIQEISRIYHPEMVVMVEDVINGFLETTDGISRSLLEEPRRTAPTEPISEPSRTNERPPTPTPNRSHRAQLAAVVGLVAIGSAGTLGITRLMSSHASKPEKSCTEIANELISLWRANKGFHQVASLINANKSRCSRESRFLIQQHIAAGHEGKHREALGLIQKAIAIDPLNPYAYYWQGAIYSELKDYKMALNSLNKGLQIDPEYGLLLFSKGEALYALGDLPGAITAYTKAIKSNLYNDPDVYRARARALSGTKDYSLALADANKAIQMNSKDGDAYRLRAFIKTWLDDFTGACSDIKEARGLGIKRVPNSSGADVPIDQKVKEICS